MPAISALPGFESGTWLTGNEDGLGLSLTLWDEVRAFTILVQLTPDGALHYHPIA